MSWPKRRSGELPIWDRPVACYASLAERLVFVSGLSDPRTCRLTVAQQTLLSDQRFCERSILPLNFPFVDNMSASHSVPGLLRASLNNAGQYMALRRRSFVERCLPHWQALTQATGRLHLITLSCGLELVSQMIAAQQKGPRPTGQGAMADRCEIRILALGPVASRLPTVPCLTICGSRDRLSTWFVRKPDETIPGLSHMDYVGSPLIRERIREWLSVNTFAFEEQAAICPPRS